jgi:hypothetical protein
MKLLHVFAIVALLCIVGCTPTNACIQNWFVRGLTEMTITNGGVTETAAARTRYLNGYGAGGVFAQEYLCPGGDPNNNADWQELGRITSDATKPKVPASKIMRNMIEFRPVNETKGLRSFVCGTGATYDVSQIKVKLTSTGAVTTHDARTVTACFWGGCSTWYEWYTPDNEWCKFAAP